MVGVCHHSTRSSVNNLGFSIGSYCWGCYNGDWNVHSIHNGSTCINKVKGDYMDIIEVKELLRVMDKVGISEVVFEPTDEGKTRLRGANREKNITIFDEVDVSLVDLPMGIQSVKGLLSRVSLFDEDKASMTTKDNGDIITDITIKEGRKKAGFKSAVPKHLAVPDLVPGALESEERITLEESYVKYLSTAITSMSYTGEKKERTISLTSEDGKAEITIYDGEDDSFQDTLEDSEYNLDDVASWEVVPFERVMKASLEETGDATFFVTDHHIAIFDLGIFNVMIVPLV